MSYALKMNLCPDLCLIMYPFKLDTIRSDKVSFLRRYLAELARASHSLLELKTINWLRILILL